MAKSIKEVAVDLVRGVVLENRGGVAFEVDRMIDVDKVVS